MFFRSDFVAIVKRRSSLFENRTWAKMRKMFQFNFVTICSPVESLTFVAKCAKMKSEI